MMPIDARRLGSPGNIDVDPLSWDDVNNQQMAERVAVEEADAYILELVRIFAKAVQCLAQYQCQDAIDELERLPIEQQHSPWVLTLTGRACYEKLDYVKV
jgi:anaphase-promoting complex subunit 3